jgi:major membrane immunogen (membrane-anchored lipoprotein)
MENRNNILNELREISPVVAGIGHQIPYSVPAGYFEGFADQLLQLVKADQANTPVLPKADHPYQVPQGYFEGLADNILQRVKAEEVNASVLPKAINPYQVPQGYFEGLADNILQRVKADEANAPVLPQAINPYQVPQGYFEGLADNILQRVKATATDNVSDELEIISPFLSQIDKKMPFSTPAGYFDELGENAIAGAQAIDFVNGTLENLSPLMSGLRRMYVYEVPAGYFEQLPGEVLKAVKAQQPARVISMGFTRRVIRYAAAAVVAGLIITAGWLYVGNRGIKDPNGFPPKELAKLDSISDELLEKYLENQTPTPAETAIAATDANDEIDANDMKDLLADVSDEDLQQYIEKYSTVKDIQTN